MARKKAEMKKNRSTGKLLAALILNRRSGAYKDLCAICTDERGFQSDEVAACLRDEIQILLIQLLKGEYDGINRKLGEHARKPGLTSVQSPAMWKENRIRNLNSTVKKIRLGAKDACLTTTHSTEAVPEEIIYDLVRRSLESGDIEYFALCRNEKCEKLFYRKSLKGRYCSTECRMASRKRKKAQREGSRTINDPLEQYLKKLIQAEESDADGKYVAIYKILGDGNAMQGRKCIQKLNGRSLEQIDSTTRKKLREISNNVSTPVRKISYAR